MIRIVEADNFSTRRDVENGTEAQRAAVLEILGQVKQNGDQAVLDYTARFDGITLAAMRVSEE